MEYSITQADLDRDRKDIIEFWLTTFPGWRQDKYDHWYMGNPCGRAACWTARESSGNRVVGALAVFPRRTFVNGEAHMTGKAGDLGVNAEHRGQGLAMELRRRMMEYRKTAPFSYLSGTPNDRSSRIAIKAGYKLVGRTVRMVKVLKSRAYFKRIVRLGPLATVLAAPCDAVMRVMSRENRRKPDSRYVTERPEEFDGRFDELWQNARKQFPLIGERTSEFLNWRFVRCSYKPFQVFALAEADSRRIAGYVVFRQHGDELHIADVLAADQGETLDTLLAEFLGLARKLEAATVTLFYFGSPALTDKFAAYGFSVRGRELPFIVFVDEGMPYTDLVRDASKWYFFEADNDE